MRNKLINLAQVKRKKRGVGGGGGWGGGGGEKEDDKGKKVNRQKENWKSGRGVKLERGRGLEKPTFLFIF